MEILEDKILTRYLFQKYSSNPKNWNFIISTKSYNNSFFDAFVSNPDETWHLKFDSLYKPNPFILGARTELDSFTVEQRLKNTIPFGYRKLPDSYFRQFLRLNDESDVNNSPIVSEDLNKILSSSHPEKPIQGNSYACGPFILTPDNPVRYSEKQKLISEKLTSKLKDNLRKRYSSYM